MAELLKGIAWKDLNQEFKNDFDKTIAHVKESMNPEDVQELEAYVETIDKKIKELQLNLLGKKQFPPKGY